MFLTKNIIYKIQISRSESKTSNQSVRYGMIFCVLQVVMLVVTSSKDTFWDKLLDAALTFPSPISYLHPPNSLFILCFLLWFSIVLSFLSTFFSRYFFY